MTSHDQSSGGRKNFGVRTEPETNNMARSRIWSATIHISHLPDDALNRINQVCNSAAQLTNPWSQHSWFDDLRKARLGYLVGPELWDQLSYWDRQLHSKLSGIVSPFLNSCWHSDDRSLQAPVRDLKEESFWFRWYGCHDYRQLEASWFLRRFC